LVLRTSENTSSPTFGEEGQEEGRSFQEPRSFLFALCSLLKRTLLYQPTYSARRTITEEVTVFWPLPSIIIIVTH
jgi:hypothetical protein